MNIGVLTGGGDVPGLNAAIRAVARRSFGYGYDVYGIKDGWKGLIEGHIEQLTAPRVSGILHVGGTILGTSRTNPFKEDEGKEERVRKTLENVKHFGLDAIVAIGGDDTLGVASKLYDLEVNTVGVPKTMDNDVAETDYCIGFDTAVTTVADALDKLHTTAMAHHRVIVVEVMGRHAGWVAVVGGLAGGADFIFIPEVESSIEEACKHVERRLALGKSFSIIVVAEGAKLKEVMKGRELEEKDDFGHVRLIKRGIGQVVAEEIEERTEIETRCVVLGHLQRGGSPTVSDRVLATRLGVYAVEMAREGKFGYMAALKGNEIVPVSLKDAVASTRTVDLDLYHMAQTFY